MLPKTSFKRHRKFSQNHRSLVGFESKWPPRLFSLDCSFGNSASGNQVPAIAITFSETIRDMSAWLRYKCLFPLGENCIFKNNLSSFAYGRSAPLCESSFLRSMTSYHPDRHVRGYNFIWDYLDSLLLK